MIDWRRFAVALAAATALVLSAPFLGLLRSTLRRAFPDTFVLIVFGLIGAALLVAIGAGVARIRDRRAGRYGLIGAAVVFAAGYAWGTASDNRESIAVELFHFVQYGLVTFLFYRSVRHAGDLSVLLVPALAGFMVGAVEEWFQWFLPARVGELRDLGLNLAAIACALLFSVAVDPPARLVWRLGPASRRLVSRFAAAAVLVFAAFLDIIHLGHRITDPEIGTLESRFSAERLLELQARRAERWAMEPPPAELRRVSREDQYLTEAMQHAQERNEQWASGDVDAAWRQNRILERYFEPALDVRWYGARDGLRWPPEQRAEGERLATEQRAADPGRVYESAAYPYPIFAWPRGLFRGCALALAAAILAAGGRASRQ